jgi:DeoR family ulaG and ulaABCDEF operon transcriptional repressor
MHASQRQKRIEALLAERQFVTSGELAADLSASPATVRRDVAALAAAGRLRRVRGGAEAVAGPTRPTVLRTPDFEATRRQNLAAKRAIARAAAALCEPGESVIVNGGTTTYCLGEFIAEMGLQVLTNSFALAACLAGRGNCRVVLPGGDIYREQSLVVSPYESDTVIDNFFATKYFIGARAIRPQGLVEGDPLLLKAEQQLLKRAERVIALVDGSKFAPRGSFILCPLSRLDLVVTDSSAPAEALAMLADAGVATKVVALEVDARALRSRTHAAEPAEVP